MNIKTKLLSALAGIVVGGLLAATSAQAQATRTWVSGVGDDANPCSRTAPCKTFAGAISKTAANGIINCIDPGGFGAVTITKSITIDCEGTFAGILAVGTNGVNVNAAGITVNLRNLSIEGAGSGLIGVNFINGAVLNIENCTIFGFNVGTASGVNFTPPTGVNAELHVTNTIISNNGGAGGVGAGIRMRPNGTSNATATIQNTQVVNNTNGIAALGDGGTGFMRASVKSSVAVGNTINGIFVNSAAGQGFTRLFVHDVMVSGNAATGIAVTGGQAGVLLDQSTVFSNDVGIAASAGGQIFSYRTNSLDGNISSNGSPTSNLTLQ